MQYRLEEELPAYQIPSVERQFPGGIRTWIHAMNFRDAALVKRLAKHYAATKQGRTDYDAVDPDEDTLKICQLLVVCRAGDQSPDKTFTFDIGNEIDAIDKMKKYIPRQIVQMVIMESDSLSLTGYIPTESREQTEQKEVGKQVLIEMLSEPQTWHQLNYLAVSLFGVELPEVDEKNIGESLNLLNRHQHAQDKVVEALFEYMQAMSVGLAG